MGKLIVIIGVVASFFTAAIIFFARNTESLRENMRRNSAQEPRLVLEEFTILRYENFHLTSALSAETGLFFEPNHVELSGNIVAERMNKGISETISSDKADAYFETTSISNLAASSKLSRAEVEDNVVLKVRDHAMYTEKADYIENRRTLSSKRPVRIVGSNRLFEGDDGFTYHVDKEILGMTGLITGVMQPDANN